MKQVPKNYRTPVLGIKKKKKKKKVCRRVVPKLKACSHELEHSPKRSKYATACLLRSLLFSDSFACRPLAVAKKQRTSSERNETGAHIGSSSCGDAGTTCRVHRF